MGRSGADAAVQPADRADAYYHCSWMDFSGGWTPGMAPHIIDLPVWALSLGYPIVTYCSGGRYILKDAGDAYDTMRISGNIPISR